MSDPTVIAAMPLPPPPVEIGANPLRARPRRRERLEFALPTINVIFLLMLYFLIAGTIVQKDELSVAPPETAQVATDRLPRPLLVINPSGALTLDGRVVTTDEVVGAAQAALRLLPDPARFLNVLAPADLPATQFLALLAPFGPADVPVRVVTVEAAKPGAPQ